MAEPVPLPVLLRRVTRCLRTVAPAGQVRVRRRAPGGGNLGLAVLSEDGSATIYLRPDLDREATIDTLLHEWAHVLAWRRHGPEVEDHGRSWGVAYGDVYGRFQAEWDRRGWRGC